MKTFTDMRINFLRQMQDYIFDTENDNLWDEWNDRIMVDPIYKHLFKIIANNDVYWKNWKNACKVFNELTKLAENEKEN